jgi:uncharacterized protein with HEPN domain
MRSDPDRLSSIDAFQDNEMLQVWVIHHMQVIGEAARGMSQSLKERHPEVPWPEIVALRNILVHEYFGLNMHQVWTMIQKDLPKLEEQIHHIRSQIAPDSGCGA